MVLPRTGAWGHRQRWQRGLFPICLPPSRWARCLLTAPQQGRQLPCQSLCVCCSLCLQCRSVPQLLVGPTSSEESGLSPRERLSQTTAPSPVKIATPGLSSLSGPITTWDLTDLLRSPAHPAVGTVGPGCAPSTQCRHGVGAPQTLGSWLLKEYTLHFLSQALQHSPYVTNSGNI